MRSANLLAVQLGVYIAARDAIATVWHYNVAVLVYLGMLIVFY